MIGEHIDYNGGYVFPCALSFGTYGVAELRNDRQIKLYSENFNKNGVVTLSLDDLSYNEEHDWANYVKGVLQEFTKTTNIKQGINIYVYGNMPYSAGLSSSASLELLVSVMFNDLYNANKTMLEMVKLSQKVENQYMGVQCGIMDQFAVGMGKENHAMLLDTATLECVYTPLNLSNHKIVIANTNKKRALADSKYNERKGECDSSLAKIQQEKDITFLCDLSMEDYEEVKHLLTETEQKRTRHVVSENIRTQRSVDVLKQNNIVEFGNLMLQSHISLKDDYEVTGKELDTLVDLMIQSEGVLGSRMTGAGFGGCTVSIVENEHVEETIKNVSEQYLNKIGYNADFYVITIGSGARKL